MRFLQLTLPSPAENLALDEALLDEVEAEGPAAETLRIWEPRDWLVVLGRTSRRREEANLAVCQAEDVPVLRRSSGGASIVTGPGCLMYAVVLHYGERPELRLIDRAHRFVLERLSASLARLCPGVHPEGTSDLAIGERKFSGNSLRCKRDAMVYHGTVMYDMQIERIGRYLHEPPRQPEYREGRPHHEFVMNLPASRGEIIRALNEAWQPTLATRDWPRERVAKLIDQRYGCSHWHEER